MSKLIVIRGPSGAGKSTVAKLLHQQMPTKTALIEQDYYRHRMFNMPHDDIEATRKLLFGTVRNALHHRYDVILEGILSVVKHQPYFDELLTAHPADNHFFYLDVPFDETVRRHGTRAKNSDFSAQDMQEWFDRSQPKYPDEHILPVGLSAQEICGRIATQANLRLIMP